MVAASLDELHQPWAIECQRVCVANWVSFQALERLFLVASPLRKRAERLPIPFDDRRELELPRFPPAPGRGSLDPLELPPEYVPTFQPRLSASARRFWPPHRSLLSFRGFGSVPCTSTSRRHAVWIGYWPPSTPVRCDKPFVPALSQPETLNALNSAEMAYKWHVLKSRENEHLLRKNPRFRPLSDLRGPHDGLGRLSEDSS